MDFRQILYMVKATYYQQPKKKLVVSLNFLGLQTVFTILKFG